MTVASEPKTMTARCSLFSLARTRPAEVSTVVLVIDIDDQRWKSIL